MNTKDYKKFLRQLSIPVEDLRQFGDLRKKEAWATAYCYHTSNRSEPVKEKPTLTDRERELLFGQPTHKTDKNGQSLLFEFEDFEEPPDPDDYPNDYEWHYQLWALHYPEIAAASEKFASMAGEPPQLKEAGESAKSIIYPSPLQSSKESTKACDPVFASRHEAYLQETEPLPIGYWILYWCGQKAIHDAIRAEFTPPLVLYFVPQSKRRERRCNACIDRSINFFLNSLQKGCGFHLLSTKSHRDKCILSSDYYYPFAVGVIDKRSPITFCSRGPPVCN